MLSWIRKNQTSFIILTLLVVSFAGSLYRSFALNGGNSAEWESSFWQNFSTEMIGAVITFGLFELVLGAEKAAQDAVQRVEELKKRLIRDVASQSNQVANTAVEHMRHEGWLTVKDNIALLKNADLSNANLQGANLLAANLQQSRLNSANLQNANLLAANLEQASLAAANLHNANLESANLQKAVLMFADMPSTKLMGANLQQAYLAGANMRQANLILANLQQADLENVNLAHANLLRADMRGVRNIDKAKFDEGTRLPDDTQWTPGTDMRRFTDPQSDEQSDNTNHN